MLVWMDEMISEERAEEMLNYLKNRDKDMKEIPKDMMFNKVLIDHDKKRYDSCIIIKEGNVL